jgi:hypothetical protein
MLLNVNILKELTAHAMQQHTLGGAYAFILHSYRAKVTALQNVYGTKRAGGNVGLSEHPKEKIQARLHSMINPAQQQHTREIATPTTFLEIPSKFCTKVRKYQENIRQNV